MKQTTTGFKKYFLTGLAAILPLWITIYILWVIFKLIGSLTAPFLRPIYTFWLGKEITPILLRLSSFVLTLFIIYITGLIASNIAGKRFLLFIEKLFIRIPLLRPLYSAVRKLVQYIFTEKVTYRSVVVVEYPRKGTYSMGFVTSEQVISMYNPDKVELISVFIPTTPNPTTGVFLLVPKDDVIPVDITLDEAFKIIISGGVILSGAITFRKNE